MQAPLRRLRRRGRAPALGAALAMAAAAPAQAQDVTTIKVPNWQAGGPAYWEALVAALEAANPGIDVELETVPFDRCAEVQGPSTATQSGPDVMRQNAGPEIFDRRMAHRELSPAVLRDGADIFASGNAAVAGTIIADALNWAAFGAALGDENLGAMLWAHPVFAHRPAGEDP